MLNYSSYASDVYRLVTTLTRYYQQSRHSNRSAEDGWLDDGSNRVDAAIRWQLLHTTKTMLNYSSYAGDVYRLVATLTRYYQQSRHWNRSAEDGWPGDGSNKVDADQFIIWETKE